MAGVVVPVGDPAYQKYLEWQNLKTLISANKSPTHTLSYRQQLPIIEQQLVDSLMNSGRITPDNVLSACTYGGGDTNTN